MPITKPCGTCGVEYPPTHDYFSLNYPFRGGLMPFCHKCGALVAEERRQRKNERSRAWAQANRDKARASTKQSYQRTRRERLEYLRRYRQANKERLREYAREYRANKRNNK